MLNFDQGCGAASFKCGSGSCVSLKWGSGPAFRSNADPVMGICDYLSVDPPWLHFELPGLHSTGLHGSVSSL
jgi:hypothetical protein